MGLEGHIKKALARGATGRRATPAFWKKALAGLLLCLPTGSALAGAWTLPAGETKAIVTTSLAYADSQFGPDGRRQPRRDFRKIETTLYVEFGIADQLTFLGEVAHANEKITDHGFSSSNSGPARVETGARLRLGEIDDTLVSLQAIVALHTEQQSNDPFASKSGDLDYEIALATGAPFTLLGVEGFSTSLTAYRYRPGGRADEVSVDATIGLKPADGWMILFQSLNFISVGREALPGIRTRSHKAKLSIIRQVHKNLSIELGAFKTLTGENMIEETAGLLGFWYHF